MFLQLPFFFVQNFNYSNNLILPNSIMGVNCTVSYGGGWGGGGVCKTCFTNQKLTIFWVISFMMQVITYL